MHVALQFAGGGAEPAAHLLCRGAARAACPGERALAVPFSGIQPLQDRGVTSLLTLLQPPVQTQQLLRGFAVWPNWLFHHHHPYPPCHIPKLKWQGKPQNKINYCRAKLMGVLLWCPHPPYFCCIKQLWKHVTPGIETTPWCQHVHLIWARRVLFFSFFSFLLQPCSHEPCWAPGVSHVTTQTYQPENRSPANRIYCLLGGLLRNGALVSISRGPRLPGEGGGVGGPAGAVTGSAILGGLNDLGPHRSCAHKYLLYFSWHRHKHLCLGWEPLLLDFQVSLHLEVLLEHHTREIWLRWRAEMLWALVRPTSRMREGQGGGWSLLGEACASSLSSWAGFRAWALVPALSHQAGSGLSLFLDVHPPGAPSHRPVTGAAD